MPAISDRIPPVAVEYDAPGGRAAKRFGDPYEARRFYVQLLKAGRRPAVVNPNAKEIEMATKTKTKKQTTKAPAVKQATAAAAKPTTAPAPATQAPADAATTATLAATNGKPAGVRPSTDTVSYLAGLVLKRHGLEIGVTPEMVAELDTARGKQKPDEAKAILAWAWHAIRGFQAES